MEFPLKRSQCSSHAFRDSSIRVGFWRPRVRVKKTQLALYSRRLATLLNAGVPLVQALKILEKQERKGVFHCVVRNQIAELEGGSPFSTTLRSYPGIFDQMYVSLVVAGEKAGVLHSVMDRLARYLERSVQTAGRIKSAMTYPFVVLCAAVAIVSGLLMFVVPQFEEIFESMLQGAALPTITRWVLGVSGFVQSFWLWVIAGIAVLVMGARLWLQVSAIAMFYDRATLVLPQLGSLVKKATLARFCRTFGTLLESAVPILDAMETATNTLDNRWLEAVFRRARSQVRDGAPVATALDGEPVIPPVIIGMVEVGEATGQLPAMLIQIAETYEQEVEAGIDGLTILIEPLMILVLAIIIGFLVIALLLPIVEIMHYLGA